MSVSSAQAEDGLANGCEDGRGSWGEETRMVHTLGKSHRPRSVVAQATGIRQAGVPTGPATQMWAWDAGAHLGLAVDAAQRPRVRYSSPFRRKQAGWEPETRGLKLSPYGSAHPPQLA